MSVNRRQVLISLAMVAVATAFPGANGEASEGAFWGSNDVDWDEVINDVICKRNALISGAEFETKEFRRGSPHWCMEQVLDREFLL